MALSFCDHNVNVKEITKNKIMNLGDLALDRFIFLTLLFSSFFWMDCWILGDDDDDDVSES